MRTRLLDIVMRHAVAGTVSVLFLRGLTLASRFLLSLLLARMLSPAEMGQYGILTAALAFALLGIGLEFYTFTLREMVAATPVGQARIIANQIALGTAALIVVGILVLIIVLTGIFPSRLAPWFFLILITEHVSLEATRFLIISSRPVRAYLGIFLRGGIWVYALAILMYTEPSSRTLEAVLLWWIGGGSASIILSAISLSDLPWRELKGFRPDWKMIAAGLRTARPFMLTAIGASTISYVDRFVIDDFLGKDALGIYTFYSTILIGLLSLGGAISHQFLPGIISHGASFVLPVTNHCGGGIDDHFRPCDGAHAQFSWSSRIRVERLAILRDATRSFSAYCGGRSFIRIICGPFGQVLDVLQSWRRIDIDASQCRADSNFRVVRCGVSGRHNWRVAAGIIDVLRVAQD
jgi:hypothetical protein